MGIRAPFDHRGSPDRLVDKMIGTAYPTVRLVAENIEYVKHVSYHLEEIFNVAANMGHIKNVESHLTEIIRVAEKIGVPKKTQLLKDARYTSAGSKTKTLLWYQITQVR